MLRRRPSAAVALLAALAVAVLAAASCTTGSSGDDGGTLDQKPPSDGVTEVPSQRSVDFIVSGCGSLAEGRCVGVAPLVLSFSAVTIGVAGTVEWDFGDESPVVIGEVVTHVFALPGTYDVTLIATVAEGTLSEQRSGFVVVEPAAAGQRCLADEGCASKSCICRDGCPYPMGAELCVGPEGALRGSAGGESCLRVGLCLSDCEKLSCPARTACVDLGLGVEEGAAPWRTTLCLPTCNEDIECARPGFHCRLAPVSTGWRRVCLPSFPRFVGEPCRDGDGRPDDARCLGGLCLDIGAGGYCSAPCAGDRCPEGTRCASFSVGDAAGATGPVCLLRCDRTDQCKGDPLLACQPPQPAGLFGIEVVGPADPPGSEYCGVKRCSAPDACGLSGFCDGAAGGFCRLPKL